MSSGPPVVAVAGLVLAAVLLWPAARDLAQLPEQSSERRGGRRRPPGPAAWSLPFRPGWGGQAPSPALGRGAGVLGIGRLLGRQAAHEAVATDVLLVLDLMAAALTSGAEPQRALAVTVAQLPEHSSVRARLSAPGALEPSQLPQTWRDLAAQGGAIELVMLSEAWRLSVEAGVPLAAAVERCADAVRQGVSFRGRVQIALAGPRATMWLLTALPLLGPPVGWAFGVDPGQLYWSGGGVRLALVAGLVLLVLGWCWCQLLVGQVRRA